jgi:NAD(P)-dependent dehydrogenase (short-subunit alcohol dehydrogenase family)
MLLKDRVAIITGGAMGIGKGIAVKFAGEGCSVVIGDVSAEGKKTADEISRSGAKAIFVPCDVTQSRQVQEMVDKAIAAFGKIDILVNNAGGIFGYTKGSIEEVTEAQWDRIIDLNLKSQFLCSKAVVPWLKKNKYGRIINISSIGAVHPPVAVIDYHSAKAGVLGLTINLAVELAPFNILVNAILPGMTPTAFWKNLTHEIPDKEAFFAELAKKEILIGRPAVPDDIAGVALFLASELSSYMTGSTLYAAGGKPLVPLIP